MTLALLASSTSLNWPDAVAIVAICFMFCFFGWIDR